MKFTIYTTIIGILALIANYISYQIPEEVMEGGYLVYYYEGRWYSAPLLIFGLVLIVGGYLLAACIQWHKASKVRDKALSDASMFVLMSIVIVVAILYFMYIEDPEFYADFDSVLFLLIYWAAAATVVLHRIWVPKIEKSKKGKQLEDKMNEDKKEEAV